jgi:hypothetical protein
MASEDDNLSELRLQSRHICELSYDSESLEDTSTLARILSLQYFSSSGWRH